MTRRRDVIPRLAGVAGAAAQALEGSAQGAAIPAIGVLDFASADRTRTNLAAFRQGLEDAGITEGRNAVIESR